MVDFDVIVAGAGPAGCAAAISLSQFEPNLRICLIDAASLRTFKVGETVPPTIAPILRHLRLWDRFLADGHLASYRTVSCWGQQHATANEYLLLGDGAGWHLDRVAFDDALLEAARMRVAHFECDKVIALAPLRNKLRVITGVGSYAARFGIDATGRAAVPSRMVAGPPEMLDRLIACVVRGTDSIAGRDELLVESFADGWWYSALVPGGRRVIACMTDTDQARRLGLTSKERFLELLSRTRHVQAVMNMDASLDGPEFWPATSQRFPTRGDLPLIRVGDAAFTVDPICGQGIVNALRSGVFASYAIADWILRGDDKGLRRYKTMMDREFHSYRAALLDVYGVERRWTGQPFWSRRRPVRSLGLKGEDKHDHRHAGLRWGRSP
jgi:flavin-dependent dehydrogenase